MDRYPKYFAAHRRMQVAAERTMPVELVPAAAAIELAKLLTQFDSQIDEEWRANIVHIGGGLISLDRQTGAEASGRDG